MEHKFNSNMIISGWIEIKTRLWNIYSCNVVHEIPCTVCRLCVIAGNISPIDVITHVPILCEEADIRYLYVPSKEVSEKSYQVH